MKTIASTLVVVALVALAAVTARSAHAQAGSGTPTEIVTVDKPAAFDAKTAVQGWNPFLALTASLNLVDNEGVIGQVNGTAVTIAGGAVGGAEYIHDRHFLSLTGTINEGFARTPVVTEFVKINDVAKVDGIYNYFATENLGGYARLSLQTSLFDSDDILGAPATFVDVTGKTPVTLATNVTQFHLADAWKPFTLTESIGAFADPIRKPEVAVSLRLGIGGRSTIADGSFALHPNPMDTTAVEVIDLSDVEQLGIEAFAGVNGKFAGTSPFTYKLGAAVLLPFVNDDSFHRKAIDLTRIVGTANLTYSFAKWLAAVYSFQVIRDPQLFPAGKEQVQVQNTLLLTFQLGLVAKKEGKKAKTKDELELEAAKAAAQKAATEALELQVKIRDLERQLPCPPPTEQVPLLPPPPGDGATRSRPRHRHRRRDRPGRLTPGYPPNILWICQRGSRPRSRSTSSCRRRRTTSCSARRRRSACRRRTSSPSWSPATWIPTRSRGCRRCAPARRGGSCPQTTPNR